MVIVDANAILRVILNDNEVMANEVKEIIKKGLVLIKKEIIEHAINTFQNKNIDFVDCLLYAYHSIDGSEIFTFDVKLKNLLKK